ncbi:MAG: hypothetical protein E7520_01260 [Ruminococcaceae bacterium]|nr:hypothetical protein [Oscillospiraceae bacterium]
MVRLIRWVIGFVRFCFFDGFADGFLNACIAAGEPLRNVHRDGAKLYADCPASHYLALSRLARAHGGRLKVVKRKGMVFPFLKMKNRFGLFAGAVAFVVIISALSGFVWNVEIVGNERIDGSELERFIADNGLHSGVFWDGVEKDRIENLVMASFDDCAWVHINEIGTTARIEIRETRVKPKIAPAKTPANLKATDDGIIVKADVYDGWQVAKKGDSVTKGDLLISGIYDSEKKKGNQFAHARGEYLAQVVYPLENVVSREQSKKVYTTERAFKEFVFFGLRLPLYFGRMNLQSADVSTDDIYLKINDNAIPIGVVTAKVRYYTVQKITLSDKELTALCKAETEKQIQSDYADCEIVKKKYGIDLGADSATAKGKITVLKDIGEEVPIKIKK